MPVRHPVHLSARVGEITVPQLRVQPPGQADELVRGVALQGGRGIHVVARLRTLTGWTWTEVAAALNPAPGQLLVDLGCGRGGYGLEIARQAGARLLGLDFSPVAVTAAASRAASAGIAGPAAFCVGDITAAGIGTNAADAVVCIETIMFAGDAPGRALRMPPDPRRRRTARPDVLGGDEPRGRAAAAVGTAPLT